MGRLVRAGLVLAALPGLFALVVLISLALVLGRVGDGPDRQDG